MDEEVSTAFTDNLVLSWSEGQTFALTPDQVRELSKDDLIKIWKVGSLQPSWQKSPPRNCCCLSWGGSQPAAVTLTTLGSRTSASSARVRRA